MALQAAASVTTLILQADKLLFLAFPLTPVLFSWHCSVACGGSLLQKVASAPAFHQGSHFWQCQAESPAQENWEGVVQFLMLVSKYSFHSKKFKPKAAIPPYPKYNHLFPIPSCSSEIFWFSVAFSVTESKCSHDPSPLLFQTPFSTFSSQPLLSCFSRFSWKAILRLQQHCKITRTYICTFSLPLTEEGLWGCCGFKPGWRSNITQLLIQYSLSSSSSPPLWNWEENQSSTCMLRKGQFNNLKERKIQ